MSCQLESLNHLKSPNAAFEGTDGPVENAKIKIRVRFWTLARRVARTVGRLPKKSPVCGPSLPISPGDIVLVRSEKEIRALLSKEGSYKGCYFMEEMFAYCGKEFEVIKEIVNFFDEAKRKMVRTRDLVVLKDVLCGGRLQPRREKCDRTCFFFWHKDWLCKAE